MKKSVLLFRCLLFFFLALSTALAQSQELTVQTDTGKEVVLSRADLEALPRVKVTTGGTADPTIFEGVTLKSVLDKAGVGFGESLKGKRLASYLLVEASDGYRVVIALPELDPAFTAKQILLADRRNGKNLDDKEGPYRLVIPDEKRMARWVKQVKSLKVVEVP
jgi:hypothetical protein